MWGRGYEFVKKGGRRVDRFGLNLSSNVLTYVVSMQLKNAPKEQREVGRVYGLAPSFKKLL